MTFKICDECGDQYRGDKRSKYCSDPCVDAVIKRRTSLRNKGMERHLKADPATQAANKARYGIDWGAVVLALSRAGYSLHKLAAITGLTDGAIHKFKNRGRCPEHWVGELLLELYDERVAKPRPRVRVPRVAEPATKEETLAFARAIEETV